MYGFYLIYFIVIYFIASHEQMLCICCATSITPYYFDFQALNKVRLISAKWKSSENGISSHCTNSIAFFARSHSLIPICGKNCFDIHAWRVQCLAFQAFYLESFHKHETSDLTWKTAPKIRTVFVSDRMAPKNNRICRLFARRCRNWAHIDFWLCFLHSIATATDTVSSSYFDVSKPFSSITSSAWIPLRWICEYFSHWPVDTQSKVPIDASYIETTAFRNRTIRQSIDCFIVEKLFSTMVFTRSYWQLIYGRKYFSIYFTMTNAFALLTIDLFSRWIVSTTCLQHQKRPNSCAKYCWGNFECHGKRLFCVVVRDFPLQ